MKIFCNKKVVLATIFFGLLFLFIPITHLSAADSIELQVPINNETTVQKSDGLILNYAQMVYRYGLTLVGSFAVLMAVLGGIQIAASRGNQSAVNEGKERLVAALTGLVILLLSGWFLHLINPTFFTLS